MGGHQVTTVIAVLAALVAAFCFAAASLVQQTAARASGADEVMRPWLLLDLARRPLWLAGIGLDMLSFFILALALAFGPLTLVQPLAALDVLFVLPLIARRRRRRQLGLQLAGGVVAVIGIFVLSRSSIVTAEQSAPREPAVATMRGVVMAEGD